MTYGEAIKALENYGGELGGEMPPTDREGEAMLVAIRAMRRLLDLGLRESE